MLVTGTLQAQSKLSGKTHCAKPDPSLKNENDTYVSDVIGNLSRDRGYGVGSVANGDQYFVRFDGTTTLKADVPVGAQCTWTFRGGTGKLKGLTGKGTCNGTSTQTGRRRG